MCKSFSIACVVIKKFLCPIWTFIIIHPNQTLCEYDLATYLYTSTTDQYPSTRTSGQRLLVAAPQSKPKITGIGSTRCVPQVDLPQPWRPLLLPPPVPTPKAPRRASPRAAGRWARESMGRSSARWSTALRPPGVESEWRSGPG